MSNETHESVNQFADYKVRRRKNANGESIQAMYLDIGVGGIESPVTASNPLPVSAEIEQVVLSTTGTQVGDVIYMAEALPGSALGDAVWRAYKFDAATLRKTWADGNENFDNVATDLTLLSYS